MAVHRSSDHTLHSLDRAYYTYSLNGEPLRLDL